MILTAKTEGAYCVAANLPCSLPLGGWRVDVDPDMAHALDPEDYEETAAVGPYCPLPRVDDEDGPVAIIF